MTDEEWAGCFLGCCGLFGSVVTVTCLVLAAIALLKYIGS